MILKHDQNAGSKSAKNIRMQFFKRSAFRKPRPPPLCGTGSKLSSPLSQTAVCSERRHVIADFPLISCLLLDALYEKIITIRCLCEARLCKRLPSIADQQDYPFHVWLDTSWTFFFYFPIVSPLGKSARPRLEGKPQLQN